MVYSKRYISSRMQEEIGTWWYVVGRIGGSR